LDPYTPSGVLGTAEYVYFPERQESLIG